MRQQIFLTFLVISLLFIGSVFSEQVDNAKLFLKIAHRQIFDQILGNDTAFEEMMGRNNFTFMLTYGKNGTFLDTLQKMDDFTTKFMKQISDSSGSATAKDIVVNEVLEDKDGMKQKIINNLNCITEREECKENDLTDDAIIKKVTNAIRGKEMAEVVSAQNDSIEAIAKNDTQIDEFLYQKDFRKAAIKKILNEYQNELIENKEFDKTLKNTTMIFLEKHSADALKMYLKANPTSVIFLKLLILSPMIIAWISSLICIASMCGCCYPFGLSEPSSSQSKVTASKSNDKKGKKSADKKEKKKNAK